jgi:hypothetical protein
MRVIEQLFTEDEHTPEPLQESPVVQTLPSSQEVPAGLLLQLLVERLGLQTWHAILGCGVPGAW